MRETFPRNCAGFSIVELMVVTAIFSISIGLAAPAMSDLVAGNRVSSQANSLVTSLSFARSQAVSASRRVELCPYRKVQGRTNPNEMYECTGLLDWSGGWMAVMPAVDEAGEATAGKEVLKLFTGIKVGRMTGTLPVVSYDSAGFLTSAAEPRFSIRPTACTGRLVRNVVVSLQGRPYVEGASCA